MHISILYILTDVHTKCGDGRLCGFLKGNCVKIVGHNWASVILMTTIVKLNYLDQNSFPVCL